MKKEDFNKKFPNGFDCWQETHYEIVAAFYSYTDSPVLESLEQHKGRGGMYEFAEELTDEFENLHKDKNWDGEFYDELETFIKNKLQ